MTSANREVTQPKKPPRSNAAASPFLSFGTYFSIKCYLDQILMMRSQDGKCFSAPQDWNVENLFSAVNICTIHVFIHLENI